MPSRHLFFAALLILLTLSMSGCAPLSGIIYTHTFTPYTQDLHNTPFSETKAGDHVVKIKEPFSGLGLYAEFDSNAIGDIARKYGLTRVHFADLETFSVLGFWTESNIIVYGEKAPLLVNQSNRQNAR